MLILIVLSILFAIKVFASFVFSILLVASNGKLGARADFHITKVDMTRIGSGMVPLPYITLNNGTTNTNYNATVLGLKDYYSVYASGVCSGVKNRKRGQSIKSCTKGALCISDLPAMIEKDLATSGYNLTLNGIGFPTPDMEALNQRGMVMSILYYIAICMEEACVILAIGSFKKRILLRVSFICGIFSFLAYTAASSIGTFLSNHVRGLLNSRLNNIGITASRSGSRYLPVTWFLAIASFLAVGGLGYLLIVVVNDDRKSNNCGGRVAGDG